MSFTLLVGPPGAGKTQRLLERARDLTREGRRVWWVGLPAQRSYLYRRATRAGALLGLEFLSSQQVYYRLLAHALQLKPLIVGTGRLALVGEALLVERGELPSPGEARLFAQAIAEAKRYGLLPADLPGGDAEAERFRRTFAGYERIKGESWDYDDFRREALALANLPRHRPEVDAVFVDGFRELGPLELELYRRLGRHAEVWLALPTPPPGCSPDLELAPRDGTVLERYRAANPVTEARWVLRSLKRDLARGIDPLELAVILPEGGAAAFSALADEYGVPLMDETPRALADTLPGRLLLDLLELPDYPTASRLLAIPELQPLATAALETGVAGFEAVGMLAERLGLAPLWARWQALLAVDGDEMAWAETLVTRGLPAVRRDLQEREEMRFDRFREHALQRAKEASRLARGAHFRAWWAALLHETFVFDRPRGGVALLSAKLASGRRFGRAYLLRAVEGAYGTFEGEDYFLPEEARAPLERAFSAGRLLPRRFLGRDRALFDELLTRADELVVSYPEADQGGPLLPEPELVGAAAAPRLPEIAAGSRLELPAEAHYQPEAKVQPLGGATVERLRRYEPCGFRFWAQERLRADDARPWWLELIGAMRDFGSLNPARLEELRSRHPEAAGWLADHRERLTGLNYGVRLPEEGDGPRARLDAAERRGGVVTFYHFVAPGRVASEAEAAAYLQGRWNELWAAGHMLGRYPNRIERVDVVVWPLLGQPLSAYPDGITTVRRRIVGLQRKAAGIHRRFALGDVAPRPGFHCRDCAVFDVCRQGAR